MSDIELEQTDPLSEAVAYLATLQLAVDPEFRALVKAALDKADRHIKSCPRCNEVRGRLKHLRGGMIPSRRAWCEEGTRLLVEAGEVAAKGMFK